MSLTVNNIPACVSENQKQKSKNIVKMASLTGSIVGVASAFSSVAKNKGITLDYADIFRNSKKFLNSAKHIECNEKDVLQIAGGSIAGGFAAGMVTDKRNFKAKLKEGITQFVGNYVVPAIMVGSSVKLAKKTATKLAISKPIPLMVGSGLVAMFSSVFIGNKVSNLINAKFFAQKKERKLETQDFAVQTDDICLLTSLATKGSNVAKFASKIIPLSHLIPGYCVGTKEEG
ncbi:MAG: hypothetical protein PHV37_03495 [Candidatus Gastranaerophilales bacterium]|nr:hypothetical protein [Candidatus Gastranaerophilales bacterium]